MTAAKAIEEIKRIAKREHRCPSEAVLHLSNGQKCRYHTANHVILDCDMLVLTCSIPYDVERIVWIDEVGNLKHWKGF